MNPWQTTYITDCKHLSIHILWGRISRWRYLRFIFCLCSLVEWTLSQDSYWCTLLPSPSNCWSIWKKEQHNYYQILSKQTLRSKHGRRNKLSNNEKLFSSVMYMINIPLTIKKHNQIIIEFLATSWLTKIARAEHHHEHSSEHKKIEPIFSRMN